MSKINKKNPMINYYLLSIVTPDINISRTMTISLPNDPFGLYY